MMRRISKFFDPSFFPKTFGMMRGEQCVLMDCGGQAAFAEDLVAQ